MKSEQYRGARGPDRARRFRGTSVLLGLLFLANAAAASIRLDEPSSPVLFGGERMTLAWSADALCGEEWEAFLSVDGGRYYAFRLTPHLDLAVRRVTFVVPNVTSRDARVLLRVGDERVEIPYELPERFEIRSSSERFEVSVPAAEVRGLRGEAARPGDRPVMAWVEGDRQGETIHQRFAREGGESIDHAPAAGGLLTTDASLPRSSSATAAELDAPHGLTLTPDARRAALPRERSRRFELLGRLNI